MPLPCPGQSPRTRTSTAAIDWNDLPTRFGIPQPPSSYTPSIASQPASSTNAASLGSESYASPVRSTSLAPGSSASGGYSSTGLRRRSSTSGASTASTDDESEPKGTTKAPLGRQKHKFYNFPGHTNWFEVLTTKNDSNVPEPGVFKLNGLCDGDLFVVRDSPNTIFRMQIYKNNTWSPIQLYDEMTDSAGNTRSLIIKPGGKPSWVLKDTANKNYNSSRQPRASVGAMYHSTVPRAIRQETRRRGNNPCIDSGGLGWHRLEPVDWYFKHRDCLCLLADIRIKL
ncbi:hypothetical protein BDN72DRAFT_863169 [Pluteus cervinus]|uniref:Uncharacterized protein n=1 Tax=Pluteus cervinus TaxID=181527 RepID=A0ACD3A8P0_9AGAR|nr:hypothetical protein BDN72DRAFT_863169 [Pluteus cervinus]